MPLTSFAQFGIQQLSPFANDVPDLDVLASRQSALNRDVVGEQNTTVNPRLQGSDHARHPDLRKAFAAGVTVCPVRSGKTDAEKEPSGDDSGFMALVGKMSGMLWSTMGWPRSNLQHQFKPLTFASAEQWPAASDKADLPAQAAVGGLVNLMEQHAAGIYHEFLRDYHVAGKGITEIEQLIGRKLTVYLNRADDNLFGQASALIDTLEHDHAVMLYVLLATIEKNNLEADPSVAKELEKGFDLAASKSAVAPVVDYYLGKRLQPEAHKISGVNYRAHPNFMQVSGLRPNTKKLPVEVTEHLVYHAASALLLFAFRNALFPDDHRPILDGFSKESLAARNLVWRTAIAVNPDPAKIPRYMPTLDADAFTGLNLPAGTRLLPALIDVAVDGTNVGTDGAVALHPDNNRCLTKFENHTKSGEPVSYAVSDGKPPMGGKDEVVSVFDNIDEAMKAWLV